MIRSATEADGPAITQIRNASGVATPTSADLDPEPLEARKAWFRAQRDLGLPVPVVALGGAAGWAALTPYQSRRAFDGTVLAAIGGRNASSPARFAKLGFREVGRFEGTRRKGGYRFDEVFLQWEVPCA